ncbi:MAG: hypothetical protein K9J12_18260 [Melioribacteraceae bacterium]|nr:hypothetical protein [Melioribacteraceae bacterium]MCF8263378.1 hypothetical protein [Melioribacteraceae bacterium]MCF8430864.1 hypothetical protein [Melioribacteraceae bacterium]
MDSATTKKLKWSKILSILTVLLGVGLMIYMITVEDEPGAIPLLLIGIGIFWFWGNHIRIKKQG